MKNNRTCVTKNCEEKVNSNISSDRYCAECKKRFKKAALKRARLWDKINAGFKGGLEK